jgi:Site-specific recombinase XerD
MSQQKITDEKIVEKYISYTETNKSDSWAYDVRRSCNRFLEWCQEERFVDFDDVDSTVIVDYVTYLKDEGYADSSISKYLGCVRGMLIYADRRDWIDVDYDEDAQTGLYTDTIDISYQAEKSKQDEEEVYYLSKEQVQDIIDASDSLRDRLLIKLLYQTGIRAGEASRIRLEDINREEQKIKIRTEKTESLETRSVYYQSNLEPLLYDWLDMGQRVACTNAHIDEDEGHLFVTRQRDWMEAEKVNKIVITRATDAGIQKVRYVDKQGNDRKRVTAHTLRHTFACHRILKEYGGGMPIRFLQKLLGHSKIETTEKYLVVKESDVKEAYFDYLP